MQDFDLTPKEKANYINGALLNIHQKSDMGAVDLSAVKRLCVRVGIDEDDVQAHIATLTAAEKCSAHIVGRSYYIVLTPKFFN